MERSDSYTCYVSDHSGEIAAVNPKRNIFISPDLTVHLNSKEIILVILDYKFKISSNSFSKVQIPYCVKLLFRNVPKIGVSLKIITDKKKDELLIVSNELEGNSKVSKKEDEDLVSK